MRAALTAAVLLGAAIAAPALADPAPSVTVTYEYNFRPGAIAVTGEDGAAVLPVEADGVYFVFVNQPLSFDSVLRVSAGGSEATMTLPRGTIQGTRMLAFELTEGQNISVWVETAAPE